MGRITDMCLLTYTLPGETPDFELLEDAALSNSDGFGWAIADVDGSGRILKGHSLSIDNALDQYRAALKVTHGPSLFHLRFATHGARDVTMCHPFGSDRGRTAIAHNGIIGHVKTSGTESDTAAFVKRYWPSWANSELDRPERLAHLEGWIGSGNKLVILTCDPRYKANAYIVNEKAGHWLDGTWLSNYSYQYVNYYEPAHTPYSADFYGKAYVRINGVLKELGTGQPECTGYANACQCAACEARDRNVVDNPTDDESAALEFFALKCHLCQTEFIVSSDDDEPNCPTCDVCWYCDSDPSACLCKGEL